MEKKFRPIYKIILIFLTATFTCCNSESIYIEKKSIAFWGDSMTAGSGGWGTTIVETVKNELHRPVFNGGVAGLSSNNIACLQGGNRFIIKLSGNKIPKSGSVTLTDYNIVPYMHTTSQTRTGTVAGVKGTLTRVGNLANPFLASSFYFTNTQEGEEISVPSSGVQFNFDDAVNHRNDVTVIWAGRNDPKIDSEIPTTIGNIKSMIDYLENKDTPFLVISVCNGSRQTEALGTDIHANIILLNSKLEATFGTNYIDLRKYMVEQALYDAKIKPSAEDLKDISSDCIPSSLRYDNVHFNAKGYEVAGKFIAKVIRSKNW